MLVDNLSRSVAIKSQSQVLVAVKEARDLLFLLSPGERLADRYSARENFQFYLRLMEPDMDIVPGFNDRAIRRLQAIGRRSGRAFTRKPAQGASDENRPQASVHRPIRYSFRGGAEFWPHGAREARNAQNLFAEHYVERVNFRLESFDNVAR
jgi:hypothetical protein